MKHLNFKQLFFLAGVLFFALQFSACSNRSDADIQKDLTDSLHVNSMSNINVVVADGVATLTGNCMGDSCAAKAENIASNVDGVTSVKNNVTSTKENTDYTLRTQVQTIISKYSGVQADVAEGIIVLRGTINRSQIQPLMTELNNLKPTKIDNQLAISN